MKIWNSRDAQWTWIPLVREALRSRHALTPGARASVGIPATLQRHPGALCVWILGCLWQDQRIRVIAGLLLTGSALLSVIGRILRNWV